MTHPGGGTVLWVQMPDARGFHRAVLRGQGPGASAWPRATSFPAATSSTHFLRLSYGSAWSPVVEDALATLGRLAPATGLGRGGPLSPGTAPGPPEGRHKKNPSPGGESPRRGVWFFAGKTASVTRSVAGRGHKGGIAYATFAKRDGSGAHPLPRGRNHHGRGGGPQGRGRTADHGFAEKGPDPRSGRGDLHGQLGRGPADRPAPRLPGPGQEHVRRQPPRRRSKSSWTCCV